MNKLANFIIEKRFWLLATMLIITFLCGYLALKTGINTDMSKYLPDNSNMRQGLTLMNENFPAAPQNSTIRVMFDNLTHEDKEAVLSQLRKIEFVDDVKYDPESAVYNKQNHTLFVVSTTFAYNSPEELAIEEALSDGFDNYKMVFNSDSTQETAVQTWILLLAVSLLFVILIIMSKSWLEPFLFMLVVGIAVVINVGTNIFIGDTATLTISIGPILQLALSMDYSIILINRYRQELMLAANKRNAMKVALAKSFPVICSSALTTVVGLLALCFLSFKVGMELGIVLAKGVFISMICMFTLLPLLILWFDKGIKKSIKPVPQLKTNGLASLSFAIRYALPIVFVLLFAGAFMLQNRTKIIFTEGNDDPMAAIFPQENTTVLVYNTADTAQIDHLIAKIEADSLVKSVIGYNNTLGKPYTATEISDVIRHISSDVKIDPNLLQMLYYNRFDGQLPTLTIAEFLNFVTNDIAKNPFFASYIDPAITANIDRLKKFTNRQLLTQEMEAATIADFLGFSPEEADQIYLFYFITNGGIETGTMTLAEFCDFVLNDVAQNATYGSLFDNDKLAQIKTLQTYTKVDEMTRPQTYDKIAEKMGIDKENTKMLFVYHQTKQPNNSPETMKVAQFVDLIQNDIAKNPNFASYISENELKQLNQLAQLTDTTELQKPRKADNLAQTLGISERHVKQVFTLRFGPVLSINRSLSVTEMVNFMLKSEKIKANMTAEELAGLQTLQKIIDNLLKDNQLNYTEMADLIGMENEKAKILFTYNTAKSKNFAGKLLSIQEIIHFLLNNTNEFGTMATAESLDSLKFAQKIIDSSVEQRAYSADELASFLGFQPTEATQLYTLRQHEKGNTKDWILSPQIFVNFLIDNVLNNKNFADQFDKKTANNLRTARTLIDAVVANKAYNSAEITPLLNSLSASVKSTETQLLYLYYAGKKSYNNSWEMSIEQLFGYLTDEVMNDTLFSSSFDSDTRKLLNNSKKQLSDGLAQMKNDRYSRIIILSTYPEESDATTAFLNRIDTLRAKHFENETYVVGASSLAHEIEHGFKSEQIKITLITAIAISIVVMMAFHSLLIPLLLVLLVQCAVYITIAIIGLQGNSIYYLAMLIVQSILMGATIDYAIVFSTYYRDSRKIFSIKESLQKAYAGSIYTIMTSGLILMIVTAVLGIFTTQIISAVSTTIAIGALSSIVLILFVLPGTLAALDKLIVRRKK